jgi:hypothetical protein
MVKSMLRTLLLATLRLAGRLPIITTSLNRGGRRGCQTSVRTPSSCAQPSSGTPSATDSEPRSPVTFASADFFD